MSKQRILYGLAALVFFGIGAYTWKILRTGTTAARVDGKDEGMTLPVRATLVMVGDTAIANDDLEWEFAVHTEGIFGNEALTPIPDLGDRYEKELTTLKERLLASVIERKVLYHFIEQDNQFDPTNPARFTSCMTEWKNATTGEVSVLLKGSRNQERLKARLCEQSLITQYLQEKLFVRLSVPEGEVVDYFKNHQSEFAHTERVVIRQIVTAKEDEAQAIRRKLNRDNFGQLAKDHSITPEAQKGGLIGPFARGELPKSFDIAFSMSVGEISDILKSTYGFHIIMLEKKLPKGSASLADASPAIRATLLKKKKDDEYKKWVEQAMRMIPVRTPAAQ